MYCNTDFRYNHLTNGAFFPLRRECASGNARVHCLISNVFALVQRARFFFLGGSRTAAPAPRHFWRGHRQRACQPCPYMFARFAGAAAATLRRAPTLPVLRHGPRAAAARRCIGSTRPLGDSADSWPDHELLPLAALSPTMEQGGVASWVKQEGDAISAGDVVLELETDKATLDFEAQDDNYLAKILVPAGTSDLAVGTPLAVLVEDEADIAAFANATLADFAQDSDIEEAETTAPTPAAASAAADADASGAAAGPPKRVPRIEFRHGDRVKIASALGMAEVTGADAAGATDSSATTEGALASPAPADPRGSVDIPLTAMRKVIAARLTESKATIPHYYSRMECSIDNMLAFRKTLKAAGVNVSVNDLVIVAAALALRDVPEANAFWNGTSIEQNDTVDISVAVATDGGLITPIVKDADKIGLSVSCCRVAGAQRCVRSRVASSFYSFFFFFFFGWFLLLGRSTCAHET